MLHQQNDPEMGHTSHPNDLRDLRDEEEKELELEAGFRSPTREEAKQIQIKDPFLVEWDGPDDPGNPQNIPVWRKWVITMCVSSLTIWITFATSVFSQASVATAEEFGVSTEVTILGTSLPLFVSGAGPVTGHFNTDAV